MSEKKTTHYYDVALALPATWKQNVYTYCSEQPLQVGRIVFAPFGSAEKPGYILGEVSKPTYTTKLITTVTKFRLQKQTRAFIDWIASYYPGTPGVHVQHFIPTILKSTPKSRKEKTTETSPGKRAPQTLTPDQERAYAELTIHATPTNILHGITGSGKTRLYCELVQKNMREGKNSLILYPEISLTSQLEEVLSNFFGPELVTVYHSKRTPSQQRKAWLEIHDTTQARVIIGPRSAMFLPYENLGLVIVDEAHDSAYKQDSGTRYNGLVAAGALAKQHNAQLVFASATPPIQETQQVLAKGGKLVCMHKRAKDTAQDARLFTMVDMTDNKNYATSHLLSKQLLDTIGINLQNKKQSLLFLNKRGTARMLLCENCGWHAECPRCEVPLTHHHDSFTLVCNLCGLKMKSQTSCPECKHTLVLKSPGIKSVEQDLRNLFPSALIARFDSDNKKADTFSENYADIKSGGADIIIGTQLITKGLDLPLLETVGILQADSALMLPDYSSEERAFQQLTQVSGRVGRGHDGAGSVFVQTYQINNYLFRFVQDQDWHGFYEKELRKRKDTSFPPYSYAVKIWVTKNSRDTAMKACTHLAQTLKANNAVRILGPAPSFYEKTAGKYSWQVIVLSPNRTSLLGCIENLPSNFYFDLDPTSLL